MDQTLAEWIVNKTGYLLEELGGTYGGYSVNIEAGTGHVNFDLTDNGDQDDILISVRQSEGLFVADTSRKSNHAIVRNTFGNVDHLIGYVLSF